MHTLNKWKKSMLWILCDYLGNKNGLNVMIFPFFKGASKLGLKELEESKKY